MGKKGDRRVAMTKRLLRDALIEMLREEDIYHISIRELCERADVNRTTFYKYYGSQYDLLADIRNTYLNDIAKAIKNANLQDSEDVLSRVTLLLSYTEENLELSRLLVLNNIDEAFVPQLFSLPNIEELLTESLAGKQLLMAKEDVISFMIHGSYKLIQNWLAADNRRPAAEMAQTVIYLTDGVCASAVRHEDA